jgi:hypothetical protein
MLPAQIEAIKKEEALIKPAKIDARVADSLMKSTISDAYYAELRTFTIAYIDQTEKLLSEVETIKNYNIRDPKRNKLLLSLRIILRGDELLRTEKIGLTYYNARIKVQNATEALKEANRLFLESGLAEELGASFSEKLGGPLGRFIFTGLKLSIDIGAAIYSRTVTSGLYLNEENDLNKMYSQYQRTQEKLIELDKKLDQFRGPCRQ